MDETARLTEGLAALTAARDALQALAELGLSAGPEVLRVVLGQIEISGDAVAAAVRRRCVALAS